jgi:hypothetical protein
METMIINNFVDKLDSLNLAAVAQKLMSKKNGNGWTEEQTQAAIARYKMFLTLHFIFPERSLVPTQEIDEVWHNHILLNTEQYFQDCQHLFGHFLHHCSVDEVDETDSQQQDAAFATTRNLFEEVFGIGALGDTNSPAAACLSLPIHSSPSLISAACLTIPKQVPQLIFSG